MLNKIKIINNELIVSLIIDKNNFLIDNNIKEEQCIFLNKTNIKKIEKFDETNKNSFICLDFINNKFSKKEVEKFNDLNIENNYRIVFIKHEDLNEHFEYMMNETLVLLIDKNININNL